MTILLVRHAKAGDRAEWEGDDRTRPLTKRGRLQAEGLVRLFGPEQFDHIVTSPYIRCIETVVPLAAARGTSIELSEALAEGASLEDSLALVHKYAADGAVLCTHGDVVPMLLGHFKARGARISDELAWPKGSTWRISINGEDATEAEYLEPCNEASL